MLGSKLGFDSIYFYTLIGFLLVVIGVVFISWTLMYRKLKDVIFSSALTVHKFIHRLPLGEPLGRTEPFIPQGPYRYVRNPSYFSAISITLGLGLSLHRPIFIFWGLLLAIWFLGVLIPYEEAEFRVLFGEKYREYKRQVPKLFPYGKRYKPKVKNEASHYASG